MLNHIPRMKESYKFSKNWKPCSRRSHWIFRWMLVITDTINQTTAVVSLIGQHQVVLVRIVYCDWTYHIWNKCIDIYCSYIPLKENIPIKLLGSKSQFSSSKWESITINNKINNKQRSRRQLISIAHIIYKNWLCK